MSANLKGKTVLITGAASGIGRETALHLLDLGATIVLNDVNREAGEAFVKEIGGNVTFLQADVSDAAQVASMFADIEKRGLQLDCAINNAGVEHRNMPLHECSEELWDKTIDINLKGVFLCMQHELRHMLKAKNADGAPAGGHIINIASVAGLHSAPMLGPYSASKFGVIGLTRTAAVEYARANIRVNAVCPSFLRTPMVERALSMMDERQVKAVTNANPMRRLGEPVEAANLLAWLCSDESSFVTGQSWAIDGGLLA